jgi:hypothetical protein
MYGSGENDPPTSGNVRENLQTEVGMAHEREREREREREQVLWQRKREREK